ncbi:MAG: hypothetical protein Kow00129_02800 [Thermoleophilia bacterium]
MCHLALMTPVFGLALFLFLPLELALPAYGAVLILSGLLYLAVVQAQRLEVRSGPECLMGREATVTRVEEGFLMVSLDGELWTARLVTPVAVVEGACVRVVGRKRNRLQVAAG